MRQQSTPVVGTYLRNKESDERTCPRPIPWTLILICEGVSARYTPDHHGGWHNSINGDLQPTACPLRSPISVPQHEVNLCIDKFNRTNGDPNKFILSQLLMLLANSCPLAIPQSRGVHTRSLVHSQEDRLKNQAWPDPESSLRAIWAGNYGPDHSVEGKCELWMGTSLQASGLLFPQGEVWAEESQSPGPSKAQDQG